MIKKNILSKISNKLNGNRINSEKKFWFWYHKWGIESYYTPKIINNNKRQDYSNDISISHIATFSKWNAGDVLLPLCVKDSFNGNDSFINWKSFQITFPYSKKHIERINSTDGLVIGGGGVFIQRNDTNAEHPSGWHWNCSEELASQINVPIAFFAVGYNQFRGSDNMPEKFRKHLLSFSDRIKFVGMRNHGSVKKIKAYLPDNLHDKIYFQPCPTTIISKLYPQLFTKIDSKQTKAIGINCAFDRVEKRFLGKQDEICQNIADALKMYSIKYDIVYLLHSPGDVKFIPYLKNTGIKFKIIDLVEKSPEYIIYEYQKLSLTLGMRGHSQMIPFGCRIPIISLISHDKLGFFLDDIGHNEWGIEILNANLKHELETKIGNILNNKDQITEDIDTIQNKFYHITQSNAIKILKSFS